jgi:putative SOS response-associated peptidase YedK
MGLVPFWSKDGKAPFSTINARTETVATSPAFREALKRRRCLVPADLFFEWQKVDAQTKQPFAIALKDGALFAFAGLWETWKDKATGETKETYTIITTDPNEVMTGLHDRMPTILSRLRKRTDDCCVRVERSGGFAESEGGHKFLRERKRQTDGGWTVLGANRRWRNLIFGRR